ncbi:hypothetical protein ACIQAC_40670 [Streptomyces sp. NPDC088387]|uniref:hypothetical protein n=1 Tax=Streptomyces sp. NPDC088387 TaxID=3365859 RepID=UPI00382EAC89
MSPLGARRGASSQGPGARPGSGRARSSALQLTGARGIWAVHGSGPVPDQLVYAAKALDAVVGAGSFPESATVLVGAGFDDMDALCELLEPALEECREAGTHLLRLVMSGGAADRTDGPAPARTIGERFGGDVLAPAGVAMVVPGGSLFAPDLPERAGGWWQLSPTGRPRHLGPRHPVPGWHTALERVPLDGAPGCVIEHIPAGLLIQPAGSPPEGVDAIRYALPVDPEGPVLLVDTTGAAQVPADVLADVLAALPAAVRGTVRLVSADGGDLVAVGQEVADLLGIEVQVANGLTVLLEEGRPAVPRVTRRAKGDTPWGEPGQGGGTARTVLLDSDGNPSWQPYIRAVTCTPAEGGAPSAPRISSWRAPIGGLRPGAETGALLLDKKWQITVTRAGLWIGPHHTEPPRSAAERPVRPDVMAIDIGVPGRPLDDSLLAPLEKLFTSLQDDVRAHTLIQLLGEPTQETLRTLRRLAIRHDLALRSQGRHTETPTPAALIAPAAGVTRTALPAPGVSAGRPPRTTGTAGGALGAGAGAMGTGAGAVAAGAGAVGTGAGAGAAGAGAVAAGTGAVAAGTGAVAAGAMGAGAGAGAAGAGAVGTGASAGAAGAGAVARGTGAVAAGTGAGAAGAGAGAAGTDTGAAGAGAVGAGSGAVGASAGAAGAGAVGAGVSARGSEWASAGADPGGEAAEAGAPSETATRGLGDEADPAEEAATWVPEVTPVPDVPEPSYDPLLGQDYVGDEGDGYDEPESAVPGAYEEPSPAAPLGSLTSAPAAHGPEPEVRPSFGRDEGEAVVPATAGGQETSPSWGRSSTTPWSSARATPPAERAPWPPLPPAPDPEAPNGPDETGVEELDVPAAPVTGLMSSVAPPPEAEAEPGPAPDPDPNPESEPYAPDENNSALRTVTWLPVRPSYRSTDAERDAVRQALSDRWDSSGGAVARAMVRMPALRNTTDPEVATADLTALHSYLTAESGVHKALLESLEAGSGDWLPFLGCVASGLRRLPSYRGAAVRSAGRALGDAAELLLPGEELGEAAPIGAIGFDKAYPAVATDHYLIWSMTGRRAGAVLADADQAAAERADAAGEVLFAPGTRLRVLQSAKRGSATVVLLREIPEIAPPAPPGRLDESDRSVLTRLLTLLDLPAGAAVGGPWPGRSTGVLGVLAPEA